MKLWDAKIGAEVLTLKGHVRGAAAVSFSSDGSKLLTIDGQGVARIWDSRPFRDSRPPAPVRQLAPPPRPK